MLDDGTTDGTPAESREEEGNRGLADQNSLSGTMGVGDLQSSRAVLNALKGLQDKLRCLEDERTRSVVDSQGLKAELARQQLDFSYMQHVHVLTMQEQDAASRLAYAKLLAEKSAVDLGLQEIEAVMRELNDACGVARTVEQEAIVVQMSAEAKMAAVELQVEECAQKARQRERRSLKVKKAIRREAVAVDAKRRSLTSRIEALKRTLREKRSDRKGCEMKRRHAQAATARASHYLASLLQVNEVLVMTMGTNGRPPTHASTVTTNGQSTTGMRVSRGQPSRLRQRRAAETRYKSHERQNSTLDGVDIGSAVEEICRVARAGRDPIPSLQALYERLGFNTFKSEYAAEAVGGAAIARSLPTSPRGRLHRRNSFECGNRSSGEHDGDTGSRPRSRPDFDGTPHAANTSRSSAEGPSGAMRSPGMRSGVSLQGGNKRAGSRGQVQGETGYFGEAECAQYSFAHFPRARALSVPKQCPTVVRRLEDLAVQLERERSDVERWYRAVVERAFDQAEPNFHSSRKVQQGRPHDAGSLTRAIACLQDKAQQLEVVRESLEVLKAPLKTPVTLSPGNARRKAAALQVLRACAET